MPFTSRYEQALAFAAWIHQQQVRKGSGVPYIAHLIAVSSLVIENRGSEDEAIGALLHDAIEDQAQRFGGSAVLRMLIQDRFGENVVAIVDGCTDSDRNPKPPWRKRKEAFISRLANADDSVVLVAACDKLHNARSLLDDLRENCGDIWGLFKGGKAGSLWYYRSLEQTLRSARAPLRVVNELDRVVNELEQLAN
jgi:GTP pyrophosphokinase